MITGFSTRKIEAKKSLAETLKEAREKKEVAISEVEEVTNIKASFLRALEEDNWGALPSAVYVRGFVLAYAKYLGLERAEILRLFDTEQIIRRKEKQLQSEFSYKKTIKDGNFIVTPRILGYGLLTCFILFMFGYIIYQVSNFAGSPNLKIATPTNNSVLEVDNTDISGVADNDSELRINGEKISVTNDGRFSTNLKLHQGVNIIKVLALNKAKKETSEVLIIEYKPKTASLLNE